MRFVTHCVCGAQRHCTGGGREEWPHCSLLLAYNPAGPGGGVRQQPHSRAPGTTGSFSSRAGRGNGKERAGGLFQEGSPSAEADFLEQSTLHSSSNLQLGSRFQLAGMRPAGTCDLPSPDRDGPGLVPRLAFRPQQLVLGLSLLAPHPLSQCEGLSPWVGCGFPSAMFQQHQQGKNGQLLRLL